MGQGNAGSVTINDTVFRRSGINTISYSNVESTGVGEGGDIIVTTILRKLQWC